MSVDHVSWAFRQDVGSPTRKLVLVALAERCNRDTLICRPLIENVATDCNLSDRAARQAIKDLCDSNVISRRRRRRSDGSLSGYDYVFPRIQISAQPAAPDAGSPAAGDAAQEPEVDLEPEELLAAEPQKRTNGRPRNEIWDALAHIFGEPTTPSATKGRGKVAAELKEAGADPDEILKRAKSWPAHFNDATMTDHALARHWDTLGRQPLRSKR